MRNSKKGQVFTLDVFLAVIGIVIVLSYASMWYQQAFSGAGRIEQMKLDQIAQDVAQVAVKENLAYHDEYGNRHPNLIKGTPDEVKKKISDTMTQMLGSGYAGEIGIIGVKGGSIKGTNQFHVRSCDPSKELVGVTRRLVYYDDGTGAVPAVLFVSVCPLSEEEQAQYSGLNPSNMPNLIASISIDPQNPVPGSEVKVTVTISNTGAQSADQQFRADLRLDDSVTGEIIGSRTFSDIPAGGQSSPWTLTLSTTELSEGSHILYAVVDAENTVTETTETDNIAHAVFTVGYPDLIVLSINPDKEYFTYGEDITGKYTVKNVGVGDAVASDKGIYSYLTVSTEDWSVGSVPEFLSAYETLASAETATKNFNLKNTYALIPLPEGTSEFEATLTAEVDPYSSDLSDTYLWVKNMLTEEKEDNNMLSTGIHIGLPNIKAEEIKLYDSEGREIPSDPDDSMIHVIEGQTITVKAIITNTRNYDVIDPFSVHLLSEDSTAAGPALLDKTFSIQRMDANSEKELEAEWTVPAVGQDSSTKLIRLAMSTDNYYEVRETDEDDNGLYVEVVVEKVGGG